MSKVVAIIPIKSKSERVPGKNFQLILGKPLYRFILEASRSSNFDQVFVDSDSQEVREYCEEHGLTFIPRLPILAENTANGNDLLRHHVANIEADYYFQLFATAPLLRTETINECIEKLIGSDGYDSILTTKSRYSWFWFDNKPVNYDPKVLPRSQDALPIVEETTGLYGISAQAFKATGARIGANPYFYEVSEAEALDLDTQADLEYLRYYVSKNPPSTDT